MAQEKRLFTKKNENGEPREIGHIVAPNNVFKQELITWEKTEFGFKRSITTRTFLADSYIDSFCSEPVDLQRTPQIEQPPSKALFGMLQGEKPSQQTLKRA